jgi:pimeloyl-ACP methyl ester carboxylesterase
MEPVRIQREVILVHGLWVPGVVMSPLAMRLARLGLRCHTFSYQGRARPVEAHAERLARFAQQIGPAHFVGHSLGGLVILEALCAHPGVAVGRVVLLGTPASGCSSGRRLACYAAGRWLLGASAPLWGTERTRRWARPEPLGVVAGSRSIGLGRLAGSLHGPNDGVVSVEETAVEGMVERIVLRVSHSAMILSARVAAEVAAFLKHGRFLPRER